MTLDRPMLLVSLYVKKHRDSQYWNHHSTEFKNVRAYLGGTLVLNATVNSYNYLWQQLVPVDTLMIDKLVLPPNTDVDNIEFGSDSMMEE